MCLTHGKSLGHEDRETWVLVLAPPPAYCSVMQARPPHRGDVFAKWRWVGRLGLEGPSHLQHSEPARLAGASPALNAAALRSRFRWG